MVTRIFSAAIFGIDSYIVEVEVDVSRGLSAFRVVGLPDTIVKESKYRISTAIKNSEFKKPRGKITVNLAPASISKSDAIFDLPIAIGILTAAQHEKLSILEDTIILGELSLDGNVKKINGILSMVMKAREEGFKRAILPYNNRKEASVVEGIDILPVRHLTQVMDFLDDECEFTIKPYTANMKVFQENMDTYVLDFNDVKGQQSVKRALTIAAAGGHNVLMIGPPGSGKSMLAKRVPSILPSLNIEEAIETTKIYSIMGLIKTNQSLVLTRPFRSPHHTISDAGLIGGGQIPKPGEVSLSHNGVLFLDELPEFKRNVLEVLRQPLEDREVTISRVHGSITYPSSFILIAAMNPCPCGNLSNPNKECICSPYSIQKYLSKISGPLLDRIDIHIEVPLLPFEELRSDCQVESSGDIRKKVIETRSIQDIRYKSTKIFTNSQMNTKQIKKYCSLSPDSEKLLKTAVDELGLSARAYSKILKLSRTIADIEHEQDIKSSHIAEAINYRSLDRNYWELY